MQCNESPTLKVVDDVRIHDAMAKYDCEKLPEPETRVLNQMSNDNE